MKNRWRVSLFLLLAGVGLSACNQNQNLTFAVAPVQELFTQQGVQSQSGEFDILWVIDNSGSMASSQTRLAANMDSFISKFQERQLDFRMAVTTTEAYRDAFSGNSNLSLFRDGNAQSGPTGWPVISNETPNLRDTFLSNVLQGTEGSGDERPFASMVAALDNPGNAGFVRENGFLAVIILSDEDDFSHNGAEPLVGEYSNPQLHPTSLYKSYLESIKPTTTGGLRRYTLSSITATTQDCVNRLKSEVSQAQKVGRRIMELTDSLNGVKGDICGDFSETLSLVSQGIIELGTQFRLSNQADPKTIRVAVSSAIIPENSEHGWTFNAENNSIVFHGTAVPANGAKIRVDYVPTRPR